MEGTEGIQVTLQPGERLTLLTRNYIVVCTVVSIRPRSGEPENEEPENVEPENTIEIATRESIQRNDHV